LISSYIPAIARIFPSIDIQRRQKLRQSTSTLQLAIYRFNERTHRMLLDLPPEIINSITDHLALPLKRQIPESCPHFSHDQKDGRLAIYDASESSASYETDVLRFALVHPYIAKCMENSGRQIEADATVVEGLGVLPCAPEEVRQLVKYVPDALVSINKDR
jgi:hypothetical protein